MSLTYNQLSAAITVLSNRAERELKNCDLYKSDFSDNGSSAWVSAMVASIILSTLSEALQAARNVESRGDTIDINFR